MSQFTIGIIIVIFGVILTTIGGYVAKDGWDKIHQKNSCKKTVNTQQAAIGNDNTQVVTTGDKSPVIMSDEYVAGNKTINIEKLLSLPASQFPSIKKPKATFFVLGWLAERLPHMVREIQARGHEIASHGYNHEMPNSLSISDLKDDLIKSKNLLEDIIGAAVTGYRAPSFAINDDILRTIGDCGYQYDSSYNSFEIHGRYGRLTLDGRKKKGITHRISHNFYELPISNLNIGRFTIPLGGGGYFRWIPFGFFKLGIQTILRKDGAYIFYLHPWEIDSEQPRIKDISYLYKLRHYKNIDRTFVKLSRVLNEFNKCRFIPCSQYLDSEIPKFRPSVQDTNLKHRRPQALVANK